MFTTVEKCIQDKITVLVFGESGAGKTSLAKTLPDPKRTLIINAENGLLSIKGSGINVYDLTKHAKDDGTIVELNRAQRWNKMEHILEELTKTEYQERFDWVVIDSLTEASQNLLEALKEKHADSKDGFKVWGEFGEKIISVIKTIRDMKHYNILFLALDSVDKDESGMRYTGIDVAGKSSNRIPALIDEVFYLKKVVDEEGKEKRVLVTSSYKNIIAKDRSGKLEKFMPADMSKIIEVING